MLCLLLHKPSQQRIVVGNAHFDWHPSRDYVKYGQANFLIEKAAEFMRVHGEDGCELPLIICGDFNSEPVSSVLSAFYGEDIEDSASTWSLPPDMKLRKYNKYKKVITRAKQNLEDGLLAPIAGKL